MDNQQTTRMTLPTPINVDVSNDYMGVDRGMFSIVTSAGVQYARIISATFRSKGPSLAPGMLTFKLMVFDEFPMTPEDYGAGVELSAVYDTYTVGSKTVPIMIEYWGKTAFFNIFSQSPEVPPLNPELVTNIKTLGDSYTKVLLGASDTRTLSTEVTYQATPTTPLTMMEYIITVQQPAVPDVVYTVPLGEVTPLFDPVLYIKGL